MDGVRTLGKRTDREEAVLTQRQMKEAAVRRSKAFVRRTANRAGIELGRDPYLSRLVRLLRELDISAVVDVGANEGQYGRDLRALGYRGRIVSIEPLAEPYGRLAKAAGRDFDWKAVRAAAADSAGMLTMHVAGNSVSSSLLPMLPAHAIAAPQSRYIAEEVVTATTVDDIVRSNGLDASRTLLKIDAQGFEAAVLDGAAESTDRLAAVQLELSLVPLYEGQNLMPELVERLAGLGFELWMLTPEFCDPLTGRTLQCDGVFIRAGLVKTPAGTS